MNTSCVTGTNESHDLTLSIHPENNKFIVKSESLEANGEKYFKEEQMKIISIRNMKENMKKIFFNQRGSHISFKGKKIYIFFKLNLLIIML